MDGTFEHPLVNIITQ